MVQIIRLRVIVGFLGEDNHFSWWNTSFLGYTGQRFLTRIFPRSTFPAGLHSTTVAARQLHDESVGKGDVVHLFRLPYAQERELAESLRILDASRFERALEDRTAALNVLEEMGRAVSPATGAVRIGPLRDLQTPDGLGQIAGYYYEAFTAGQKVFPYFSDA